MAGEQYYSPKSATAQFHCPHCGVFAKQNWAHIHAREIWDDTRFYAGKVKTFNETLSMDWNISKCEHCGENAIWHKKQMIYPKVLVVRKPNPDLTEEIREDYIEAANVLSESPRSAAAILRLALQKLCKQLGEKGENINSDIKELVKKGLNPTIQKSLDALRIAGNNAVHPGELDIKEDTERVIKLFELLNFIAEKMISEPKEINAFYDGLPIESRQAVERRDRTNE